MAGNCNIHSGFRSTSIGKKRQKDQILGQEVKRKTNEKTQKEQRAEENQVNVVV